MSVFHKVAVVRKLFLSGLWGISVMESFLILRKRKLHASEKQCLYLIMGKKKFLGNFRWNCNKRALPFQREDITGFEYFPNYKNLPEKYHIARFYSSKKKKKNNTYFLKKYQLSKYSELFFAPFCYWNCTSCMGEFLSSFIFLVYI